MVNHKDEGADGLKQLLSQRNANSRKRARMMYSMSAKPQPPRVWGGVRVRYVIWYGVAIFAIPLLLGCFALAFNSVGRPLPGGAYNLVLCLAVICAGPIIAHQIAQRELKRRVPLDNDAFFEGLDEEVRSLPREFCIAVRKALGDAYAISPLLIHPKDTRLTCNSLSPMNTPLAIEVIAAIQYELGVNRTEDELTSLAATFRNLRIKTMSGLIKTLCELMNCGQNKGDVTALSRP
jgi:hypothetical protein